MRIKSTILISLLSYNFVQAGHAAMITNLITGVGPQNNRSNPYFCIQNNQGQVTYTLKPFASVDGNRYSGNAYYVGGSIRFGGCDVLNTYLGYVGFSVNDQHHNQFSTYDPPKGVHITYANPAIDSEGRMTGKIEYTPINANFNLLSQPPRENVNWDFVGVNLSGLEFGKVIDPVVVPNLSVEDKENMFSDLVEAQAFIKSGMNTMRVPISWGYLQLDGPGQGDINLNYYQSYVKPLLETLTSAKVYTIVDLHTYMRYSIFGKEYSGCSGVDGNCPDGTLVLDARAYQDIWTKLYRLIKTNPNINMNYIMFDLVNEPVDVPDDLVFTIQASVIKTLRQQGYQGKILVEGNVWNGLHSWTTAKWTSRDGKKTYSNATLFTRDNFIKAGVTDLSNIIINVHQYFDRDYSGTQSQCLTDLNTIGDQGFNLESFTEYLRQNDFKAMVTEFGTGSDQESCSIALKQFFDYMKNNSAKNKDYGFIGWTMWSAGHGWGQYQLRVVPATEKKDESYHMQVAKNYL